MNLGEILDKLNKSMQESFGFSLSKPFAHDLKWGDFFVCLFDTG